MKIRGHELIEIYNSDIKFGRLEIPYGVTAINIHCFSYDECRKSLKTVIIPETVRTIAEGSFYNFRKLKRVRIDNGLKYIHKNAFSGCRSLEHINLPNTLTLLGESAFSRCAHLKKIKIPGSH